MNWIELTDNGAIQDIKQNSKENPVLIFKHSTRCSISSMALNRLERSWSDDEMASVKPYYLDLIRNRDISDNIADVFKVQHQSPQVLIIRDGEVTYHDSHMNINYDDIKVAAKN